MMDNKPVSAAESYRSCLTSIMSLEMKIDKNSSIDEECEDESVKMLEVQSFIDVHLVSRSVSGSSKAGSRVEVSSNCMLCILF